MFWTYCLNSSLEGTWNFVPQFADMAVAVLPAIRCLIHEPFAELSLHPMRFVGGSERIFITLVRLSSYPHPSPFIPCRCIVHELLPVMQAMKYLFRDVLIFMGRQSLRVVLLGFLPDVAMVIFWIKRASGFEEMNQRVYIYGGEYFRVDDFGEGLGLGVFSHKMSYSRQKVDSVELHLVSGFNVVGDHSF